MTQGVYEIVNLFDGKATAYVGSAVNVKRRWSRHRRELVGQKHHNEHLERAWHKYGAEAFEFCVIEEVADVAQLLEREQYWLDRYFEMPASVYNIARDAQAPMQGLALSDEHKRKIGEASQGRAMPEAAKSAISRSMMGNQNGLGHPCSEKKKQKISEALTGREFSDEWKRKIGASVARPYPSFIHRETGEIIPLGRNLSKLCQGRGWNRGAMCQVALGHKSSYKGWQLYAI